jgi:hypothetical protein
VQQGSQGRRSLLRRLQWALGAALTLRAAAQDATAGAAHAVGGSGEAAFPVSKARAPAVATAIVLAALCCCPLALAADPPPTTTPTSTTPDAPPPDPYKPPAPAPKPKASHPSSPAPVHSAPVVHRPTYSPPAAAPAPAPVVPVHRVQTRRVAPRPHPKPHARKIVHKRRHHVAAKPVAPKPVKVTFNPFANLVVSASLLATGGDDGDRSRYLWLAGFAFALLAAGGLSLHVLSVRVLQ